MVKTAGRLAILVVGIAGILWVTLRSANRQVAVEPIAPAERGAVNGRPLAPERESSATAHPTESPGQAGAPAKPAFGGIVVDSKGRPIAGASVRLRWPAHKEGFWDSWEAAEPPGVLEVEAGTDKDGRFGFSKTPPGDALGDVRTDGRPPHPFRVSLPFSGDFRIVLSPAAVIEGQVRLETGEPLPESTVAVRAGRFLLRAESLPDGSYRLEVPPGESLRLRASCPWRDPVEKEVSQKLEPGARWEEDIAFPSGSTIEGLVQEPEGSPAAAAKLMLIDLGNHRGGERESQADDSGRFRFQGLPTGDYVVHAESARGTTILPELDEHAGGGEEVGSAPRIRISSSGSRQLVGVRLSGWAGIRGRVLDAGDQPVVGVLVYLSTEPSGLQKQVKTVRDGWFEAKVAPWVEYTLGVAAPHCFMGNSFSLHSFPPLQPGEIRTDHLLRFESPVEVRLLVTDEDGEPIERARVTGTLPPVIIHSGGGPTLGSFENEWTGPDGYLIDRGWRHVWYYLKVQAAGYQPAYLSMHIRDRAQVVEKLMLRDLPPGSLSGIVLSLPDEKPITAARVSLRSRSPVITSDPYSEPGWDEEHVECLTAETEDSGKFTFSGVGEDFVELSVWAEGFVALEPSRVKAGEGELRLLLSPESASSSR